MCPYLTYFILIFFFNRKTKKFNRILIFEEAGIQLAREGDRAKADGSLICLKMAFAIGN